MSQDSLAEKILSFQEFVGLDELGRGKINNFHLFFDHDLMDTGIRRDPAYQALLMKDRDLATDLCGKIQGRPHYPFNTRDEIKPYFHLLYRAYVIMRESGASDHDLLK